jgi:5-methyltetrahydrofolate--homocysteine methyltransferase
MTTPERIQALRRALAERVLVLDGAMGTTVQELKLTPEDFGGPALEGCNENLVLTRPDVIRKIHADYLLAGADVVETDTFGATPLVLAEYRLADQTHAINVAAARLAREACDAVGTPDRPRWVAGSIGPTTKSLSLNAGISFADMTEHYRQQAAGLHEGGVDYFLIETGFDTRNIKAALIACHAVNDATGLALPIAVSVTINPADKTEQSNTARRGDSMLAGQTIDALCVSVEHEDLFYIGMNCATGPDDMTDHIRTLSGMARFPVGCVPNAGMPDAHTNRYMQTPQMMASVLQRFGDAGWLNVIGGCCGTNTAHIRALAEIAPRIRPRTIPTARLSTLSGIDYLEITDDRRPVLVGERTNVIGSRKFKELIAAEKFEDAGEVAKAQVKAAAQILDVCLANPDRSELADTKQFLERVIHKVRLPFMIDSTDAAVIAESLTWCQGKAIINSINLEDGEERYQKVVPLARKFGAALVVGCIDEDPIQGMAVVRQRKLAIAERSYELLTTKYGIAAEDIYFDPLVFPCATGDQQYIGSAVETIEGVRLIKQRFPKCRTVLGISNVSFGLPALGREVLNSVFLYHCVQAGLDLAIVNTEKLERYPSIAVEERTLAEDLLWNRGEDPIGRFAGHFRNQVRTKPSKADMPIDERVARCVIEGSREGLIADLDTLLKDRKPLDIINGPLMKGMDEVSVLFRKNELIVAEVLQSAEVMKLGVSHLEPFMEKVTSSVRGKVLLATVKGDVHDIGKNLVDIILSNNGFEVVNLGIKATPEQIIHAVEDHKPDIIGLSGLLVKSAHQMVTTAGDLTQAGIRVPMMVGGAALTRSFVDRQISAAYGGTVAYAQDAMNGLEIAKQIVEPAKFEALKEMLRVQRAKLAAEDAGATPGGEAVVSRRRSTEISALESVPAAPDFDRHIVGDTSPDLVWRYINPMMLYGRHLGLKGSIVRTIDSEDVAILAASPQGRKALELREAVDAVKAELRNRMKVRAVYQFFRAESEGNTLKLSYGDGRPAAEFLFSRQPRENGLCLADLVRPAGGDTVAMFAVTAGEGIRQLAEEAKARGEFLKSHALQAVALETAEATAEWLHTKIRSMWGFPDDPSTTMLDRFRANYRGKRYSFGYPACPRLEDQDGLFKALRPQEIGIELSEEFMMEPEASVSALVFHHPDATYFSIKDQAAVRGGEMDA